MPTCVDDGAAALPVGVLVCADAGLSTAGDLREEVAVRGSAECWRFS